MTEAAPAAGFRSRVLARAGEAPSLWRSRSVLAPVAVTAIVLLAVTVVYHQRQEHHDGDAPAARPARSQAASTAVPSGPTTAAISGLHATKAPRAAPTSRGEGTRRAVTDTAAHPSPATERASEVDELAPPRIEVDSIAVDRLASPEPLTVQQIEISSIVLAPIGDGDRQ